MTATGNNEDITFGPNFMSDDIPIFQKEDEVDDSDWKDKLADEAAKVDEKVNSDRAQKKDNKTDPGFMRLVSLLGSQAYIFLGAVENPATGTPTPQIDQARETIDCLAALLEKSKGNTSEEEDKLLKQVVSELQMLYVEATRGPTGPAPGTPTQPPQA